MNQLSVKCDPCLSEKELKKRSDQEVKDIKATLNYLARNHGYDKELLQVIGSLVVRLITFTGPLK